MKITLTVEDGGRKATFDVFEDLFEVVEEPVQLAAPTSIKWRDPLDAKNARWITIRPFNVTQEGMRFTIHYTMLNDLSGEKHTFRVPADNLGFIADAVDQGIFEMDEAYRVRIEQVGKTWYWIEISRK